MKTFKGFVQVYTGDGKGKTTAALGLALRAAGAGMRILFSQFAKGMKTSEQKALRILGPRIVVKQFGRTTFIRATPAKEDIAAAHKGFTLVRAAIESGAYDLVVLDEINFATHCGLVPVDDLLALIAARPKHIELVLTGRHADPRVIDAADLVTDMREIKHYYRRGVAARKGIEM